MKNIIIALTMLFLSACTDRGSLPTTSVAGDQGTIAFRMLKTDAPADAWTIEARLEREGFATIAQSVFVRTSPDTIRIAMSGIVAGSWKVTVVAKDSTGNIRSTGSTTVQIVEGQTVQALVQMGPASTTGNLEILVAWTSASKHLQLVTAGSIFRTQQIVPVSVTNVSRETVIPSSCCTRPDLRIQQKVNGIWTPPGACELMCPAVILPMKPGQRTIDTAITIAQPGRYRLLLRYLTSTTSAGAAQYEAYSNEFTIVGTRKDSAKIGEEFVLGLGESISVQGTGVTVVFLDVAEDSRCPEGARCVWAGNGKILAGINQTRVELNTTLDPNQVFFGSYIVRLNSLSPFPMLDRRIQKKEYAAAMVVTAPVPVDSR
jgi:hypothetical protein